MRRIVEKILPFGRPPRVGPIHVPGQIDPQRQFGQLARQLPPQRPLDVAGVVEQAAPLRLAGLKDDRPLTDHLPRNITVDQPIPALAQRPLRRLVAMSPAGHVDQQRELGEVAIGVQVFQWIAGEQLLAAVGEQIPQRQVDRPHGAMKVNRPEQFRPGRHKTQQRVDAFLMHGQPRLAEKTVMQQPVQIERPRAIARHVSVAEHEVHVVDRVDAA